MTASQSGNSKVKRLRRAWQRPTVTELKIGTETKSKPESANGPQSSPPPPAPPAEPATKLGFSFEWGFPLSSRLKD